MHQAITTKYLGPTNTRGSRIKASCQAGSITVSWDHTLNNTGNHRAAAEALASRLGWHGEWAGGFDRNCHGVFVNLVGFTGFLIEKEAA